MKTQVVIALGKTIKHAARLRGGGSAMPGLVIEKLDPGFLARMLGQLPHGIVLITGTNGKTTTTKIVVALLQAAGLQVFTNRSGSNFTRGVVSEVLGVAKANGRLPYNIAVLELDEAHATHFVKQIAPRHSLALNVMRDQLDRFGEIDHTAWLLQQVVQATTHSVVLNQDDPRVAALAPAAKPTATQTPHVTYFGASNNLQKLFVTDDALHGDASGPAAHTPSKPNDVELVSFTGQSVTYKIDGAKTTTNLRLSDVYNFLNAAGALALCRAVLRDTKKLNDNSTQTLLQALSSVQPAFGRGETFTVGGHELELTLVKNPGGFRLALSSFNHPGTAVMIAINDNYADGRDMSWLWDVDFRSLQKQGVQMVSGVRAYDMALRLQYDDVPVGQTRPSLAHALERFVRANPDQPKRIFCTYTAMLALRRELKKYTTVERAL